MRGRRTFAAVALVFGLVASAGAGWAVGHSGATGRGVLNAPVGSYFMNPSSSGFQYDKAGIPMVTYEGKLQYNSTLIAGQALLNYNDYLRTGSLQSRATFLQFADWLVAHQANDGLWLYKFKFAGQPAPWWSALAQGHGLAVLSRAYQETGDARYMTAAGKALRTFTKTQAQHGVKMSDGGYTWYEEYMKPKSPHTLNGFMFSLIGVHDYNTVFGDSLSLSIWNAGIRTLEHELPRFDTGSWSCYSFAWPKDASGTLGKKPTGDNCRLASISYQNIHVWQLRSLSEWSGSDIIKGYADRFEGYLAHPPASVVERANAASQSPAPGASGSPAPSASPTEDPDQEIGN